MQRQQGNPYTFVINAFASNRGKTSALADALEYAYARLIIPILEGLPSAAWQGTAEHLPPVGQRTSRFKLTEANWTRVINTLRTEPTSVVECRLTLVGNQGVPVEAVLSAELPDHQVPDAADQVWFSVDSAVAAAASFQAIESAVIDATKAVGQKLDAVTGALDRRPGIRLSPEENTFELDLDTVLRTSASYIRRVAWALLLGPEQIARLGGRARIEAEAPVAITADLSTNEHELLYIQATADSSSFTEDERRRLAQFLIPVRRPDEELNSISVDVTTSMTSDVTNEIPTYPAGQPPAPSESRSSRPGVTRLPGFDRSPDLALTLEVRGALEQDERESFTKLIDAWYEKGLAGAFGGAFHNMTAPLYSTTPGGTSIEWWVDLGTSNPDSAIDALADTLAPVWGTRIEELTLGERLID